MDFFLMSQPYFYRVGHNLWQFPGNWLQIEKYDRYSNFEAIFEKPCLFTSSKVQKITHSAKIRVFNLLFLKATKKSLTVMSENISFTTVIQDSSQSLSFNKLTFLSPWHHALTHATNSIG